MLHVIACFALMTVAPIAAFLTQSLALSFALFAFFLFLAAKTQGGCNV